MCRASASSFVRTRRSTNTSSEKWPRGCSRLRTRSSFCVRQLALAFGKRNLPPVRQDGCSRKTRAKTINCEGYEVTRRTNRIRLPRKIRSHTKAHQEDKLNAREFSCFCDV